MLVACWSPKGGSGTSVVAAACALVLARQGGARLADLGGDQPAILGLGPDPAVGLLDWLAAGPEAPGEALDRLAVEVAPGLDLLPRGTADEDAGRPSPETGAALGVALRDHSTPTVADLGSLLCSAPAAAEAFLAVADVTVVVLRGCYLALRAGVGVPAFGRADGIAFVNEPERAISPKQVLEIVGPRPLVKVPVRARIARLVDAGVFHRRLPDDLRRAMTTLLVKIGVLDTPRQAA